MSETTILWPCLFRRDAIEVCVLVGTSRLHSIRQRGAGADWVRPLL